MGRGLLLLVSGFIVIFGIIQKAQQNREQVLAKRAPEYYYQEQSRNIAGAMLEIALGNMNEGKNYLPQKVEQSIKNTTIYMLEGVGKIEVEKMTNFNSRMYVKITGEIDRPDNTTAITTINAVFTRKPFSIYAYFTDRENGKGSSPIYFTTGDILSGPVHTNGKFHFKGEAVFNGPITSHSGRTRAGNPIFNDAKNFNAEKVELPKDAPEIVDLAQKDNGGIGQFNDDIYVEFKGGDSSINNDGSVEISETQWGCQQYYNDNDQESCIDYGFVKNSSTTKTYNLADFNGVISSNKDLLIKGTIDGQVTVHAEKDVKIVGDVTYENRNYEDKTKLISDDRLGIISNKNTIVSKYAQYDHGSQNISIDASILTLGDSFTVEDYKDKKLGNRGTINLLGGLIQRSRGAVGKFVGKGRIVSGFNKNYTYDTRFLENSTPGFPRKEKFEIENWRESTKVVSTDKEKEED